MSPKRLVFLASGIFGAIGILVSVVIIAINGGFSGSGPSIFNPPTSKDLWTIGSNIVDGKNLTYSLTTTTGGKSNLKDSIVSMNFHDIDDKWNINFKIQNGSNISTIKEISANYSKKQLLRTDPITQQDEKFVQPIEGSILVVRDLAREPKYLVVGAIWDKIFTGSSTEIARIEGTDTISTPAGTYNVYSLEYNVGNSTSRIYLNKDSPLPIKAEVYDENDKILYEYELQSVSK
ncbi:MAG TPA: hypothetical protein VFH19_01395 [Nitrososphaeraceae archaeon]|jgi:hypothetical protein|nr:hypothetical protein [Nitrososphaeraceae archaeon]